MTQDKSNIIGSRYEILEKLGAGGMGVVYRVVDRLNNIRVALKQVTQPTDGLDFSTVQGSNETLSETEVALANEFSILASFRHPNIISVLDYGFNYERKPYFTMELLEGANRITDVAHDKPLEVKVRLLMQLLQALAYLHRRSVIHRDLKPENVLVTSDGQVKVLDFGLALARDYMASAHTISGTLAYIAPEVLQGTPVSIESDLYAFGVIAYEVLLGEYPYDKTDINALINNILHDMPKFEDVDTAIELLLARLLSKDPSERYHDANTVMEVLADATGYEFPRETLAIRESYLQAASFVAREDELKILDNALRSALSSKGSAQLIGGESGVGKSRLINEIRVRALVENILVLRGQAIAEGGTPYHVWRDILRWLAVVSELEELEASVIAEVVPNLAELLGYDIAPAPDLEPQAKIERMTKVVSDLIARQTKPVIFILEDLQWADDGTLKLLQNVTQNIADRPFLILGTYRNDERPKLPNELPDMQLMTLNRLNGLAISELAQSMLGKVGDNPKIVGFLESQSGGNIFFVIEVLRALADEVGELRKIAEQPLPDYIVTGGIIAVLQQRVNRVPDDAKPLLRLAAIIGRDIDESLLKNLQPDTDLQMWLTTCAEYGILEPQEQDWRFTHDQLRERLLKDMEDESAQRGNLHLDVAKAIEHIYSDSEQYHSALAHHYYEADVPDKAHHYLVKAGQQALAGSYNEALEFVDKAVSLDGRVSSISSKVAALRASIRARAHYGLGDFEKSEDAYRDTMQHMSIQPVPHSNGALIGAILRQAGRQLLHRWFPSAFINKRDGDEMDGNVLQSILNLVVLYYNSNQPLKVLYCVLVYLNTAEVLRPSQYTTAGIGYASMTYATHIAGLASVAKMYERLALKSIQESPEIHTVTIQRGLGGYAYHSSDWQTAHQYFSESMENNAKIGDLRVFEEDSQIVGNILEYIGSFQEALETLTKAYEQSIKRDDRNSRFSLFASLVGLRMRMDNLTDFDDLSILEDDTFALDLFDTVFSANQSNLGVYRVLRARYMMSKEKYNQAWQDIQLAADIIETEGVDVSVNYFKLYDIIPEICHELLSQDGVLNERDRVKCLTLHEKSLDWLKKYAKPTTYATPRYHLHRSLVAHNKGDTSTRQTALSDALSHAKGKAMPYDEGLVYSYLAEHTNDESQQAQYLERARQLFSDIGAHEALKRVNA